MTELEARALALSLAVQERNEYAAEHADAKFYVEIDKNGDLFVQSDIGDPFGSIWNTRKSVVTREWIVYQRHTFDGDTIWYSETKHKDSDGFTDPEGGLPDRLEEGIPEY